MQRKGESARREGRGGNFRQGPPQRGPVARRTGRWSRAEPVPVRCAKVQAKKSPVMNRALKGSL